MEAPVDVIKLRGKEIKKCPPLYEGLTELHINDTLIDELPALPSTLKVLICAYSKLHRLPSLPLELRILTCSDNLLTSLPPLGKLTKLEILNCSYNFITNIDELPPNLEYLNCSFNQLETLPPLPKSVDRLISMGNINEFYLNPITTDIGDYKLSALAIRNAEASGLSPLDCLKEYTLEHFVSINHFLRGNIDKLEIPVEQITTLIWGIDKLLDMSTRSRTTKIVYRGTNTIKYPDEGFIERGYLSTTTNVNIAKNFSAEACCIYKLHVDKNMPFLNVRRLIPKDEENNSEEDEIIFPRGLFIIPFEEPTKLGTKRMFNARVMQI